MQPVHKPGCGWCIVWICGRPVKGRPGWENVAFEEKGKFAEGKMDEKAPGTKDPGTFFGVPRRGAWPVFIFQAVQIRIQVVQIRIAGHSMDRKARDRLRLRRPGL